MTRERCNNVYLTLAEAGSAAQKLFITSQKAYIDRREKDPCLPVNPARTYSTEWQGWPHFLGKDKYVFYQTLSEARCAVMKLKMKSQREYQVRYKEDLCLPRNPHKVYAHEWEGWYPFLGKVKHVFYETQEEACKAALALNINSVKEYAECYKNDPRLPSDPTYSYAKTWRGWDYFLGRDKPKLYITLELASAAAMRLKITSSSTYQALHKKDPCLPVSPPKCYATKWQGWPHFLGVEKALKYRTIAEASAAVTRLNIKSCLEYKARYKADNLLPSTPPRAYAREWQGWRHFLCTMKLPFKTFQESIKSVRQLNVNSIKEYRKNYRKIAGLPANPNNFYANDWQGWHYFLGKQRREPYKTIAEASAAAKRLNIQSRKEYIARYEEDLNLPFNPRQSYVNDWQGWHLFLGLNHLARYKTFAAARAAVKPLHIKSGAEYNQRYKEDPSLPSHPEKIFSDEWQDWSHFLGGVKFYATLAEASQAAVRLNIKSLSEYLASYKSDPRLPSVPAKTYAKEWQNWHHFLHKDKPLLYDTLAEASKAAQKLNIQSSKEYKARYKEDSFLPSKPFNSFAKEWLGWRTFLGLKIKNRYALMTDASLATQRLRITSHTEYLKKYKLDPRLPSAPDVYYSREWISWVNYLLPKKINTLEDLKLSCKILQLKDSLQYRVTRKEYKILPAHPERLYGWVDWYDLLDIPVPYTYKELVRIIRNARCQNLEEYKKFRSEAYDPRLPSSPMETYEKSGWTNTYDFFGKARPYQVKYFDADWKIWADCITKFLKQARGGTTK